MKQDVAEDQREVVSLDKRYGSYGLTAEDRNKCFEAKQLLDLQDGLITWKGKETCPISNGNCTAEARQDVKQRLDEMPDFSKTCCNPWNAGYCNPYLPYMLKR